MNPLNKISIELDILTDYQLIYLISEVSALINTSNINNEPTDELSTIHSQLRAYCEVYREIKF